MGQPSLCLIPMAFVCQLGGITWAQWNKEGGRFVYLSSCPGWQPKTQARAAAHATCALQRKQPRSNRWKDPVHLDSETLEKQLDPLGEPWCLQPGLVWRHTTIRVTGPQGKPESNYWCRKGSTHHVASKFSGLEQRWGFVMGTGSVLGSGNQD